ncbi:hypothetical protein KP509_27G047500 [Ceratopteris richardii]|uniref:Methyltransferase type 11 domain-containing protein n=1 Tax=Ceratopteris richardii TaxID=49495 RepID=A0A8T2RHN8_CERRI|nr:hypothetical protein KP509_27G047500 [Ceratopteris richardii]
MANALSFSSSVSVSVLFTYLRMRPCRKRIRRMYRPLLASSTPSGELEIKDMEARNDTIASLLACPICFKPLELSDWTIYKKLKCQSCGKVYVSNGRYLDLTFSSLTDESEAFMRPSTELFRNPAISFFYERGYRQGFQISGYPGPDEELKLANKYMETAVGGTVIDLSCATGIFTRRMIKCGLYKSVIGLDYSETMLEQFHSFIQEDQSLKEQDFLLVRADVGRLPFATETIDAVHAGAAIHCWPSAANGVAEVCRVLKPDGVFIASTQVVEALRPFRQVLRIAYGAAGVWTEEAELRKLCENCGLSNWSSTRNSAFIMFSAQKPRTILSEPDKM